MSFSSSINQNIGKVKGDIERTFRGAALSLFKGIIQSSPVDTGRFRANWFASKSDQSNDITESTDKTGNNAIMRATQLIVGEKDWQVFTLTNNLPYAESLEMGHSPQSAPYAMVRGNMQRVAQNLNNGRVE